MNDFNSTPVFQGSEIKLNLHLDGLPEGVHMSDLDFKVTVYTMPGSRTIEISKAQTAQVDEDNFLLLIDTRLLAPGHIALKISTRIPDADFPEGMRSEVVRTMTGITLKP